jgi:P27 family predicted phage terminase small subunit
METWSLLMDSAVKRQDRYFKQAQTAAAALGLTISSRCKLALPAGEEKPKVNKFAKFGDRKAAGGE